MSHGIIIGGGHNGLVTACYLAKAGHSIDVYEARGIVGGAAVTEEFHPGYRNSTASYTVSLLHPKVIEDLRLHHHGLRILDRKVNNLIPLSEARSLVSYPDIKQSQASIAQFSTSDADALPRYYDDLDEVVPVIRWAMEHTPPAVVSGGIGDLFKAIQLSRQFSRLTSTAKSRLLKLFSLSAAEYLEQYFESDPVKALFGFDAVVGHFDSPYSPGSAYVLLHHVVGGVNGKTGNWGHAVGGMGAITQAMAAQAQSLGVNIHLDSPVKRILTTQTADSILQPCSALGIEFDNGKQVLADFIVSNLNPARLMNSLIDPDAVPAPVTEHFKHYKNKSGTFRLNVALSELPQFLCQPDHSSLDGGIIMAPSLDYMDAAYQTARIQGYSSHPIVEMLIPSTVDDSLAPPGKHVASLFCQHFDPKLKEHWDVVKDDAIAAIFDVVETYAPGFRQSIIAVQSHSPWDLEKKFGLTGGDIFHGRLSLDQLFSARPMLEMGQYQTHIPNLFMCGAGTHPGGGVSGIPGMNAAREIIHRL